MKFGRALQIAKGEDWVIHQYYEYLRHRDPVEEGKYFQELANPKRDRTKSWSASASGSCLRAQQFTYLGMPQERESEGAMGIFVHGDFIHLKHQVIGLAAGYITHAEVPLSNPYYAIRGTMDARLSTGEILEIKSINSYGFSHIVQFGAKRDHVQQIHSYMLLTATDRARILYENKNDQTLKEFVINRDERIIRDAQQDLEHLNELTLKRQLAPQRQACKNQDKTDFSYRYCPFSDICEEATWPRSRFVRLTLRTSSSGDV